MYKVTFDYSIRWTITKGSKKGQQQTVVYITLMHNICAYILAIYWYILANYCLAWGRVVIHLHAYLVHR